MPGSAVKQPQLEYKAVHAAPGAGLLATDDTTGVVEAIVSVTGVEDEVKDTIEPGAYADTLTKRMPKGIFGHDWGRWVAKTLECREMMPGDAALPKTTPAGDPWPAEAGALYVKCQFNLDTTEGKDAYHNVKFFSDSPGGCEWSVGYQVPAGKAVRTKNGGRRIKAMDLFEYSPVLFGAAPLSGTLSIKASGGGGNYNAGGQGGTGVVTTDDPDNPVDAITQEADQYDPDMAALHEAAMAEMDAAANGWDAVDAAAMIDPGEENLTEVMRADQTNDRGTKVVVSGEDGRPVSVEFKDGSVKVSDTPWSNFSAADYTPAQYHRACLIHLHGPGTPDNKEDCKLPVREPDGTLNRNGVHAAAAALAGARGGVNAPSDQRAKAASALRGMYRTIGDTPPDSLQAKVLTSSDVTGTPPTGPSGPIQLRARLSGEKWTGSPDDYTVPQWHNATLIHTHDDGTMPDDKSQCMLPVTDPDGTLNLDGMNAAADALPVGGVSDDKNREAAAALRRLFGRAGVAAPDGLQTKTAGKEVTPADVAATERLRQWYEHGGGATQINWGVPGDWARCVSIAGQHMDPERAKGYCQLRHKGATGFYAGHAPTEEAAHTAAKGAADAGKGGESKVTAADLAPAYTPALETGPMGGGADPWTTTETKGAAVLDGIPGSVEELLDSVSDAVTGTLGGGQMVAGMPRYMVVVNATYPDHVIASRYDAADAGGDGDSFQVPYRIDGGEVVVGEAQPVTLTITGEADGGIKGIDEPLSALPVLIEHVTGFIRRGMQVKEGRVLSTANVKLLRGAVDQLVSVLQSAGIPIDIPGNNTPDPEEEAANAAGSEPLYLPDSTAPAAQVNMNKVLLDPGLVSRAYQVHAAAHATSEDAQG